jgi:glycosyltransferase involved in cell wall biosynthesis
MKVAILTTDSREHFKDYKAVVPSFGAAPEALLQGFAQLPGLEVHVVSCAQQPMQSPTKLADNICFHSLPVSRIGWMRTLYSGCVRSVRRKLGEIRPDIVHGQGTERDCALAAVLSGYPNVVTLHGIMVEQARLIKARFGSFYWLAARLEKFALRRTTGVFCNSQYTEGAVSPLSRETWRVPNAIREAFFRESVAPPSLTKCIFLNIGDVCPRKQQNELLAAARELHREGLKFELHFLGRADSKTNCGSEFLQAVEQNKSFASYLGFKSLDEIIYCYDSASALVHVPAEESFGLVVAEALARNLKFFGFKTGGVPEIAAGVEGADCVKQDDWNALKTAIRSWIDKGSPRPISATTIMRERYHPTIIAQRHVEIYREVLNKSS